MKKIITLISLALILTLLCSSLTSCVFFVKDIVEGASSSNNEKYPLGEDSTPYTINYYSRGDGTCKATVNIHPLYRKDFELVIPDKSSDGDTVTEVDFAQPFASPRVAFPAIMSVESRRSMNDKLKAKLPDGENDRLYSQISMYYAGYDVTELGASAIRKHPFLEYTLYGSFLDTNMKHTEYTQLRYYMERYLEINVTQFAYSEYRAVTDVLLENGITKDKFDEYIPEIDRYVEAPTALYITSVTFPSGLKKLHTDDMKQFFCAGRRVSELPNGRESLLMLNYAVVPAGAGDEALYPLMVSGLDKLYLLGEYTLDISVSNFKTEVYTYSETQKSGCWHYVDGVPTEW